MYKIALIRSDFFWYSRKLKLGSATMAKISKPNFVRKFESKRKFGELKLPDLLNQDLYNIVVGDRSEEEDRLEERVRDDDKKFHEGVPEYLYCPDGRGRKDQPTWDKYLQQIKESGGYDIIDYPGLAVMAPIHTLYDFKQCRRVLKTVTEVTDAAMKEINKSLMEDDDEFEVDDILTVNVRGGMTSRYYITFEAKKKKIQQGGAPLITTFQTMVTKTFITNEIEVEEWRIKHPAQGAAAV